jgi:hypothetical protein
MKKLKFHIKLAASSSAGLRGHGLQNAATTERQGRSYTGQCPLSGCGGARLVIDSLSQISSTAAMLTRHDVRRRSPNIQIVAHRAIDAILLGS